LTFAAIVRQQIPFFSIVNAWLKEDELASIIQCLPLMQGLSMNNCSLRSWGMEPFKKISTERYSKVSWWTSKFDVATSFQIFVYASFCVHLNLNVKPQLFVRLNLKIQSPTHDAKRKSLM